MMLFGALKNGGVASITIDKDQIMIVATPKELKVPLLAIGTESIAIEENAV